MRRSIAAAALALLLVVGACGSEGGGDDAASVLEDAQSELADTTRAEMRLALLAGAGEGEGGPEAGFEVAGPYDVDVGEGELPVARLTVTRIQGDSRHTTTLISTGTAAFVEQDGATVKLDDSATAALRAEDGGAAVGMSIADWFVEPRRQGDGRVTGSLDVVRAMNDVFAVAAGLGAGSGQEQLSGDAAERVRKLVRESSAELVVDDDRRPKRLTWSVVFAPQGDEQLQAALGDLGAARLRFELELDRVGERVRVEAPVVSSAPRGG